VSRPLILVSNDDGYRAPGISTLATVAKEFGEVIVSAPSEERSGASQALTFRSLLRSERVGENAYSVSGTPADSVYLGILHHCPRPPSLVLAGINDGYNLGPDVYYSGTVGAAREGYFRGTSAIAASVDHGADAEKLVPALRRIIAKVLSLHAQGQRFFLNVNAPRAIESDEIKVTRLGERRYADRVERRTDLSGKEYYWIGGPPLPAPLGVETDSGAVLAGYVSITPMIIDVSDPHLEPWREKLELD
jgi:5'-nucleotidase